MHLGFYTLEPQHQQISAGGLTDKTILLPQSSGGILAPAVSLKAYTIFSVKIFTAWLNIDIPGLWYIDSIALTSKAAGYNT